MARDVRPGRRSRPLIAALFACALLSGAPAAAQTYDDYRLLLDAYASGDVQSAVSRLGRWPHEHVAAAVDAMMKAATFRPPLASVPIAPPRLDAAAMIHTELAAALINIDPAAVNRHVEIARRFVGAIAGRKEQDTHALEFVREWFDFAPSLYLVAGDLYNARAYAQLGLSATPGKHALLRFYNGVAAEAQSARTPRPAVPPRSSVSTLAEISERRFANAASIFLRALSEDQHLACARLHLGWIHFQQGDSRARKDLETALADAGDDKSLQYLAHLFLGAIDERDGRLAEARREYEQASGVGPWYQTGYVALMRIAQAQGDDGAARNAASALASLEKHEDPWWDYLGGFNLEALEWLRAESRLR